MKKFKVTMKRTYATNTSVVVVANNKDEAHDIVYNNLGDADIYRLEDNNLESAEMQDEIFEIVEIEDDVSLSSEKIIKELQQIADKFNEVNTEYDNAVAEGIRVSIQAIRNEIILDKINQNK